MNRRSFLKLAGLSAVAAPLVAIGTQAEPVDLGLDVIVTDRHLRERPSALADAERLARQQLYRAGASSITVDVERDPVDRRFILKARGTV